MTAVERPADPRRRARGAGHASRAAGSSSAGSRRPTTRSSATCTSSRRSCSSCSAACWRCSCGPSWPGPGCSSCRNEQYNQLFTMHGTIMLLMFATPLFVGFANAIMPLQIGAPDVAFPRLNMLAYWFYLFGGLIVVGGFLTPERRRRLRLVRLRAAVNDVVHSPGVGADLWIIGLALSGLGTILGARQLHHHDHLTMRAPGMTMFRMPIFTWNIFVTSILVLLAFPVLAAALLALEVDRAFGAHIFDAANGGADPVAAPVLVLRPSRGVHHRAAVLRHRHRGHPGVQPQADLRLQGPGLRDHRHRRACRSRCGRTTCTSPGRSLLPFFAFMTMLIAVPTGVKFFNWIGTMWRGSVTLRDADAVDHRLPGDVPVRRPDRRSSWRRRRSTSTSPTRYFVVAHFHYVVFGTVVFAMFAGFYFWWPKWTGKMLDERLGKVHFWLLFIGFHTTFLIQHWLGVEGMPRRVRRLPRRGRLHHVRTPISTIGAFILGASTLPFLWNVYKTAQARAAGRRSTTRGAAAARWSGRRPARRRGTTSSGSRGSAPSRRRSTCTTPSSRRTAVARDRALVDRRRPATSGDSLVKVEGRIFASLAAFFVLVAAVYGWLSREVIGTTALILSGALALAIGFYSLRLSARLGPRPEDRPDAEISEGAGEYGFYSPHSWWPLPTAASAAIMMLGFAFGWWLTVLGAVLPHQLRRRVRVRVLPRLPRRGLTDQGSARAPRRRGPPRRTRRGLLRRRGPAVPEQPVRLRRRRSRDARRRQLRACARTRSSRCAPRAAGSPRWTCGPARRRAGARGRSAGTAAPGRCPGTPGSRWPPSTSSRRTASTTPAAARTARATFEHAHAHQGPEHGRHARRPRGRRGRHAAAGGLHGEGDRPGGRRARPPGHHVGPGRGLVALVQRHRDPLPAGDLLARRHRTSRSRSTWPASTPAAACGATTTAATPSTSAPTALVSTVDITAHTMTVRQDGAVLRVIPVTTGKDGYLHPRRHQGDHLQGADPGDGLAHRGHPAGQPRRLPPARLVRAAADLVGGVRARRTVVGRAPGPRERQPRLHRHERRERRLVLRHLARRGRRAVRPLHPRPRAAATATPTGTSAGPTGRRGAPCAEPPAAQSWRVVCVSLSPAAVSSRA